MAYQSIGRGSAANDGTGDDLRTGAGKVNDNFVEVYTYLGDGSTLSSDAVVTETATQTLTNKTITGTFTGNVTGDVTGNADTATTLETARTIAGQSFDGSANITIAAQDLSDVDQDIATTDAVQFTGITSLGDNTDEGFIILNCETNAHGQTIKPQPHSEGVTNTLTLPAGGDQELVGTTDTQTLTNKTLTSPTITGTGAIAGTFTGNITGDVTGDVTGDLTGDVTGNVTGNLTGNVTGNVDGQVILSEESQTGDGSTTLVVDPTKGLELLTSSASAESATLANGTTVGQTITVLLESDGGGDVTLTPATFLNGTTIAFADAGDSATMVWTGTNGWAVIGSQGSPTIA